MQVIILSHFHLFYLGIVNTTIQQNHFIPKRLINITFSHCYSTLHS